MKEYIQKIRSKLGKDKFIHPAARIIVENELKEVLFVRRRDNGQLGIPAGALEEEEDIAACIRREVLEETGIRILELKVIGISSDPARESVSYPNGDQIQYFTIEFFSNKWEGTPKVRDVEEIREAQFLPISFQEKLPENERSAFESLGFYRKFGHPMLK